MRTTIDLPDDLFRKAKALAALQGTSLKKFMVRALERETEIAPTETTPKKRDLELPIIKSWRGKKLDLTNFDFDDLLG